MNGAATGLPPELDLIIWCVRSAFGHKVPPAAPTAIDWDELAGQATRQGLAPLVYGGLNAAGLAPPEETRASLRTVQAMSAFGYKIGFEPALRQTYEVLEAAGVPAVALKGAALAYLAYPHPTYRTLSDIDLLVPEAQVERALGTLLGSGYEVVPIDLPEGHHHLAPLVAPNGGFVVELHHHILPEESPYRIDMEALWRRVQPQTLGDVSARVLAPVDALLHVCVHLAFGHRYEFYPLRSLVDVLGLTSSARVQMDWDLFVDTVRAARAAGAVYWPLRLSHAWLGAPVPAWVLSALAPPPAYARFMDPVLESAYILYGRAPSGWGAGVLYRLLRELSLYAGCSAGQQVGAAIRGLFPSPDMVTHVPAEVSRSRWRYAAFLWNPRRLVRGALALYRHLTHLG